MTRCLENELRKSYYILTNRITSISFNKFKEIIDPENRRSSSFHLDHKFPILLGFINKIHLVYIGSVYNLEVINREINCSKQDECSVNFNVIRELVERDEFYVNLIHEYPFNFTPFYSF